MPRKARRAQGMTRVRGEGGGGGGGGWWEDVSKYILEPGWRTGLDFDEYTGDDESESLLRGEGGRD